MKKACLFFLPLFFFVFAAGFSAFSDSDSDPNTAVLNPGTCTGVNNLLICMHPRSGLEELTVEVEWFDPVGREYPHLPFNIDEENGFAEITAKGLEGPFHGPPDAGFIVGIPVPEYLDHEQISGMIYSYGELVSGVGNDDFWDYLDHTFDPDYRMLLNYLPVLGGPDYPARIGIVEHESIETDHIEPTLDYIVEEYYPGYYDRDHHDNNHNNDLNNSANDNQGYGRGGLQPLSHGDEFDVRCQMGGPYNMLTDNNCGDPDIIELRSDMEDVLESNLLVYHHNLLGNATPRLSTRRIWHSSTYNYRLYDSGSKSACDTEDGVRGRYNPFTRRAFTCLENALGEPGDSRYPDETAVMNTTRHELFHAFQYDYFSKTSSHWKYHAWITEGTARLSDSNPPDHHPRAGLRPVDIPLTHDGSNPTDDSDQDDFWGIQPYNAAYFWYDVLERLNAHKEDFGFNYTGIELLGRLFNEGSRTSGARDFIKDFSPFADSPYSSLRDAHWKWARSAAFKADVNPQVGGNKVYGDRCTVNEDVFHYGIHKLDRSGDANVFFNIEAPYAASMVEIKLPPNDEDHYYDITISTLEGEAGPRTQIYTEETKYDAEQDRCREFGESTMYAENHANAEQWEDGEVGTLHLRGHDESRYAYVLVGASDEDEIQQQFRINVAGPYYDKDIFPTAGNYELTLPVVSSPQIFTIDPVAEGYAQGPNPGILTPEYTIDCTDDFITEQDNCIYGNPDGSAINFVLFNTGWFSLPDGSPEVFPYEIIDERDFTASGEITVHRNRAPIIRNRSFLFRESDIEDGNTVTLDVLSNDFSPDPAADITIDEVTIPGCGDVQIAGDKIEFTFVNPDECLEDDVYWWLPDDSFYQDEFHYTASTDHGEGQAQVFVGARATMAPPDLSQIDQEMAGFAQVLCGFSPNFGGESLFIGPDAENRLQSRIMTPGATDPVTLAMPGSHSTVMEDINPNGQAAGWAVAGDRQLMPVISHRGRAVSPLNIPHGYQGRAHAINQSGIAVGQVMNQFGHARAAMWVDGRMAELQSVHDAATRTKEIRPAGSSRSGSSEIVRTPAMASMAVSINENGHILGVRYETGTELVEDHTGEKRAGSGYATGAGSDSDTGSGSGYTEESGANAGYGTSAGFGSRKAYTPLPPEQSPDVCQDMLPGGMPSPSLTDGTMGGVEGLIWVHTSEGPETRPIENEFGGSTLPLDMNDHGQVVGEAGMGGRESTTAFLWEDGSMTEIGVLEGAQSGRAMAINNQGIAVGTSVMDGELSRGFVWTEDTGIQDLNDVLESGRVRKTSKTKARTADTTGSAAGFGSPAGARNVADVSPMTIISAIDISDTGFITAYAIDDERNFHVVGISLGEAFREVGAGEGTRDITDMPERFELHQNYPNPFNPNTRIRFDLPEETDVLLEVYNILGQRIATLVDEHRQPGSHEVTFGFEGISSGTYIYRIEAGDFRKTRKMMLVK